MLCGPVGKCTCAELLSGVDSWEILRVCEGAVRRPLEDGASDCVEVMWVMGEWVVICGVLTRSHQTLFGRSN